MIHPSLITTYCIVSSLFIIIASVIFIIEKKTELITAPHAIVYLGIVICFIYFKLSSMLLAISDPFLPFENIFCALFMGGLWDALANMGMFNFYHLNCSITSSFPSFFISNDTQFDDISYGISLSTVINSSHLTPDCLFFFLNVDYRQVTPK